MSLSACSRLAVVSCLFYFPIYRIILIAPVYSTFPISIEGKETNGTTAHMRFR
jgi:hypothetical protein